MDLALSVNTSLECKKESREKWSRERGFVISLISKKRFFFPEKRRSLTLPCVSRFAPRRTRARESAHTLRDMLAPPPSSAIEAAVDALAEELAFPSSSSSSTSAFASSSLSPSASTAAPSAKLRAAAVSVLSRGCGGGCVGGAPSAPGRWRKVRKVGAFVRRRRRCSLPRVSSRAPASRLTSFRQSNSHLGREASVFSYLSERSNGCKHKENPAPRPSSCSLETLFSA